MQDIMKDGICKAFSKFAFDWWEIDFVCPKNYNLLKKRGMGEA